MTENLFSKLGTLASHHQAGVAMVAAFSVIMLSWGLEKILEMYFFPQKPVIGYVIAITMGLTLLWLTQHFILHLV